MGFRLLMLCVVAASIFAEPTPSQAPERLEVWGAVEIEASDRHLRNLAPVIDWDATIGDRKEKYLQPKDYERVPHLSLEYIRKLPDPIRQELTEGSDLQAIFAPVLTTPSKQESPPHSGKLILSEAKPKGLVGADGKPLNSNSLSAGGSEMARAEKQIEIAKGPDGGFDPERIRALDRSIAYGRLESKWERMWKELPRERKAELLPLPSLGADRLTEFLSQRMLEGGRMVVREDAPERLRGTLNRMVVGWISPRMLEIRHDKPLKADQCLADYRTLRDLLGVKDELDSDGSRALGIASAHIHMSHAPDVDRNEFIELYNDYLALSYVDAGLGHQVLGESAKGLVAYNTPRDRRLANRARESLGPNTSSHIEVRGRVGTVEAQFAELEDLMSRPDVESKRLLAEKIQALATPKNLREAARLGGPVVSLEIAFHAWKASGDLKMKKNVDRFFQGALSTLSPDGLLKNRGLFLDLFDFDPGYVEKARRELQSSDAGVRARAGALLIATRRPEFLKEIADSSPEILRSRDVTAWEIAKENAKDLKSTITPELSGRMASILFREDPRVGSLSLAKAFGVPVPKDFSSKLIDEGLRPDSPDLYASLVHVVDMTPEEQMPYLNRVADLLGGSYGPLVRGIVLRAPSLTPYLEEKLKAALSGPDEFDMYSLSAKAHAASAARLGRQDESKRIFQRLGDIRRWSKRAGGCETTYETLSLQ